MASLTTRKSGGRFITITSPGGGKTIIPLNRMPLRTAQAVRSRVNELHAAKLAGHAVDDDTSRWLAKIDDSLHAKLAKAGLVPPRKTERVVTLGWWLRAYMDERRDDLKPRSAAKLEQTIMWLIGREAAPGRPAVAGHFKPDMPLASITKADAAAWRSSLRRAGLSNASMRTHAGNSKQLLRAAVGRELIKANPFADLPSGSTASDYERHVTPDEIERVISELPTAEWRLLFGLARYAGLRVPSESHTLTWADVDWDRGRLTVRSPKTERHAGCGARVVPIQPRLMELLLARFEQCEAGERPVTGAGVGRTMKLYRAACARAGIEPWAKLWQTLRSSCEQGLLAEGLPQYAVSRWLGHSVVVSDKHYTSGVPDELFERAARCAQRQAQRSMHESVGNGPKAAPTPNGESSEICGDFQRLPVTSEDCMDKGERRRRDSNPRITDLQSVPLVHLGTPP